MRLEPLGMGSLCNLEKADREERAAVRAETGPQTLGRRLRLVADEKRYRYRHFHQERWRQHDARGRHLAQGHGSPDGEHSEANQVSHAGEIAGSNVHEP